MTIAQLKEQLDELKISYTSRMKKGELEKLLEDNQDTGLFVGVIPVGAERILGRYKTSSRRERSLEFCKEMGIKEIPTLNSKMRRMILRKKVTV